MDRDEVNAQDGLQLAVDGVSGGNYLGDASLVERLVRDFMSTVFSTRAEYHQDGNGAAAEQRLGDLAKQYGAVFMGESHAYVGQPWNSQHRLGAYLRAVVPDVGDFGTPGEAYFNFLAVQALNASIALEEGAASEDDVKDQLSEVVGDAVDVLLGRKAGAVHA